MKPLRRSVTFWCGLFVIAFLIWAWVDSRWHRSEVAYFKAPFNERYELATHRGVLELNWAEGDHPPGYAVPRPRFPFNARRLPDDSGVEWLPDFYGWTDGRRFFGRPGMSHADVIKMLDDPAKGHWLRDYHVQVPMWALVLGFILGWLPVLLWRRSRRRGVD